MSGLTIVAFVLVFFYAILGYRRPAIAFLTAPVAAVALGYGSLLIGPAENVLLAPVLFVVALVAIAASAHGSESKGWCQIWAFRVLIAIVSVLGIALALVAFAALGAGTVLPVFFVLGVVALIASIVSHAMASGRIVAMNVFSTIGASTRQNLPLPMALDCAATGRNDATGSVLRRTKTWLVKGYSLTEALRRGYPQCPARALAVLAAGERMNQVPAAIQAIETDMKSQTVERNRLRPVHPLYPVVMLVIAFLFAAGLLKYVMPQFRAVTQEVFSGEHAMLPAATRTLIAIMDPLLYEVEPVLLIALLVLIALAIWMHGAWWRRQPEKPHLLSHVSDFVRWHLPIVHWFERNRAMVQLIEVLRIALNAGCPVNEAIRSTLRLDVNLRFRKGLARWLQRVERGEPIAQSAREGGLGNPLAWAFDSDLGAGSTPAVLDMLESYYRSSYSYRVNLARFILWPLAIILLGVIVGFIVYVVFTPGVAIITYLATDLYP